MVINLTCVRIHGKESWRVQAITRPCHHSVSHHGTLTSLPAKRASDPHLVRWVGCNASVSITLQPTNMEPDRGFLARTMFLVKAPGPTSGCMSIGGRIPHCWVVGSRDASASGGACSVWREQRAGLGVSAHPGYLAASHCAVEPPAACSDWLGFQSSVRQGSFVQSRPDHPLLLKRWQHLFVTVIVPPHAQSLPNAAEMQPGFLRMEPFGLLE